jgi:serine/threonine-protein kinase
MAEAHAGGVVHRDLKPSNLFLVDEGGERIVKVLDFGISKLAGEGEAHITSTFATMGTPLYMSPEQVRSAKNVDARTDIWSLGVILFESLAGERPFQGTTTAAAAAIVADEPPSLRAFVPDLPPFLESIVMKALEKKPDARFQDVRALAEALSAFEGNRNAMRTIDAAMMAPRYEASLRPQVRPTSTPSFVHAETMAQTTPPPGPRAGTASAPNARPLPTIPATEAAWSAQPTTPRGARRAWIGLAALVALGVAGALVSRAMGRGAVTTPTTSTVPAEALANASAAPAEIKTTPVETATASATATAETQPPVTAAPTSSANRAPSHVRAHGDPAPRHSTSPPPAPTPTTAATNPLHL